MNYIEFRGGVHLRKNLAEAMTFTFCGKRSNGINWTNDILEVTCKNCLRKIGNETIQSTGKGSC